MGRCSAARFQQSQECSQLSTFLGNLRPIKRDNSVSRCFFLWEPCYLKSKKMEKEKQVLIYHEPRLLLNKVMPRSRRKLLPQHGPMTDYLIGKTFHIETDNKPLVPLLGSKDLDEMPPHIQSLRLRLMKFHYRILHVLGKQPITANALFCAPVRSSSSKSLQEEINLYFDNFLAQLPASDICPREIRECQEEGEVCQQLAEYTREGWPEKHRVPSAIKPYW